MGKVKMVLLVDGFIKVEDGFLSGWLECEEFGGVCFKFPVSRVLSEPELRDCFDDILQSEVGTSLDKFLGSSP